MAIEPAPFTGSYSVWKSMTLVWFGAILVSKQNPADNALLSNNHLSLNKTGPDIKQIVAILIQRDIALHSIKLTSYTVVNLKKSGLSLPPLLKVMYYSKTLAPP